MRRTEVYTLKPPCQIIFIFLPILGFRIALILLLRALFLKFLEYLHHLHLFLLGLPGCTSDISLDFLLIKCLRAPGMFLSTKARERAVRGVTCWAGIFCELAPTAVLVSDICCERVIR